MRNHAAAIPRLDVPDYDWWSEGLHGVANSGYATVFPQAIALAAIWDTDMMHWIVNAISTGARAKSNVAQAEGNHDIFVELTSVVSKVNIFRDTLWAVDKRLR